MPLDQTPAPKPTGDFDFHPKFGETPIALPAQLAGRSIPEAKCHPRAIDILDFMDSCQHSDGMQEFAQPINQILNWIRERAWSLESLARWADCDPRYLGLLAGNHAFELIDMPFATESERRHLVAEIVPILKRRGTLWSVRRIAEILGFTVELVEDYQAVGQWNRHKFFSPAGSGSRVEKYDWDDGTMQGWSNEIYGGFSPVAGRLRGMQSSPGGDLWAAATIADSSANSLIRVKFRPLPSQPNCTLGMIVRCADSVNSAIMVVVQAQATNATIKLRLYSSWHAWIDLWQTAVSNVNLMDGWHRLSVWDNGDNLTICIDDRTVGFEIDVHGIDVSVKKGLWVDEYRVADFDDWERFEVDRRKQAKFFSAGQFSKSLTVSLSGSPYQDSAKREYLAKILPQFVPMDVTVIVS